jgi:hypothetical protein
MQHKLQQHERDEVILSVLKALDSPLRVSGANDNKVWREGWQEVLDHVGETVNLERLKPQYFREDDVTRLNGDFAKGEDLYERDIQMRKLVFRTHFKDATRIVDIGAGTGVSQAILAKECVAELAAADWVEPSLKLIELIGKNMNRQIKTVNFNMLTLFGWDDLKIDEETSVLTVHALEQLGEDWGLLLTAIRDAKPKLCVHIEPLVELYDEGVLFDKLAADYHRKRNYLSGWLPAVQELERQGKAEIKRVHRWGFGNRFHEAYSLLVWRPL